MTSPKWACDGWFALFHSIQPPEKRVQARWVKMLQRGGMLHICFASAKSDAGEEDASALLPLLDRRGVSRFRCFGVEALKRDGRPVRVRLSPTMRRCRMLLPV